MEGDAQLDEARYAAIIGKRAERYLARFRRFAAGGRSISWNWAAFFGTFAWLRYRGLYAWSWPYFFLSTPLLIAYSFLATGGDSCRAELVPEVIAVRYTVIVLAVLGFIVPPLFADRIYFAGVRRLAASDAPPAGTGRWAPALVHQGLALLFVALTAPIYGAYQYRARIAEGVMLSNAALKSVTEYVMEHKRMPARIEDTGATTRGTYVSKLELAPDDSIVATFGEFMEELAGHTVAIVPSRKDGQIIGWTCRSQDLPNVCLPANCRRAE